MRAWLTKFATAGLAFGASWSAAVWYWRATDRVPDGAGVALWLVVLPLALLGAAWAAFALLRRAPASAEVAAPSTPPVATHAAAPAAVLAIAAAAVRTPHGASVQALAQALAAGAARPELDPELRDEQDYPVLSARVNALDEDTALLASLPPIIDAQLRPSPEQRRALALGGVVAGDLAALLGRHPDIGTPAALPTLRLHCLWTPAWTPDQRAAAAGWLRGRLAAGGWPAAHILIAEDDGSGADQDVVALLARLHVDVQRAEVAVVLACDSRIGTASIAAMAAAGQLLGAHRPQGLLAGEGACALLLADPVQARRLAGGEAPAALHRFASAMLDRPADDVRPPAGTTLQALSTRALDAAGCAPAQVLLVAADTDQRTSRVIELMSAATGHMPQLDPMADVLRAGEACGASAPVAALAALALAADAARERAGAVLFVANLDPVRRAAAVVAPVDFQP